MSTPGLFGFPELPIIPALLATRTRVASAAGRSPASRTGETGTQKSPVCTQKVEPHSPVDKHKTETKFVLKLRYLHHLM